MSLPDQLQFHTLSHKELVFTARKIDDVHYMISWDTVPQSHILEGKSVYTVDFMQDCIHRKIWTIIDPKTNEQALDLMNED